MIVPSRSTNIAAALALPRIMLEAGDQFIARDSGGAEFADDNSAGVICNFGRFDWSGAADEAECEKRDRSVTRAGDIENLARFGGAVMRSLALSEKRSEERRVGKEC